MVTSAKSKAAYGQYKGIGNANIIQTEENNTQVQSSKQLLKKIQTTPTPISLLRTQVNTQSSLQTTTKIWILEHQEST